MTKRTMTELLAESGPAPLPTATRTITLIKGQHLAEEVERLRDELVDFLATETDDEAAERRAEEQARTRKLGAAAEDAPEVEVESTVEKIRARKLALDEELAEHQYEVELVGIPAGEWVQFKEAHPPREGNAEDLRLAGGRCSYVAVLNDLGRYVAKIDGEPVEPGQWKKFSALVHHSSLADLVTAVVAMYETRLDRVPKLRSGSSTTAPSETD